MNKACDDGRESGEAAKKKIAPWRLDDEISMHRDGREFLAVLMAEALDEDDHLGSDQQEGSCDKRQ